MIMRSTTRLAIETIKNQTDHPSVHEAMTFAETLLVLEPKHMKNVLALQLFRGLHSPVGREAIRALLSKMEVKDIDTFVAQVATLESSLMEKDRAATLSKVDPLEAEMVRLEKRLALLREKKMPSGPLPKAEEKPAEPEASAEPKGKKQEAQTPQTEPVAVA